MLLKDKLQEELDFRGWNVKDLAADTGLSVNKLNRMLHGGIPKEEDLEIVCEHLDFSKDEVVFDNLNISVEECANIMGKSTDFVRAMVKNGAFGYCVGSTFHIPRLKFEQYMGLRPNIELNEITSQLLYLVADELKKVGKKLA